MPTRDFWCLGENFFYGDSAGAEAASIDAFLTSSFISFASPSLSLFVHKKQNLACCLPVLLLFQSLSCSRLCASFCRFTMLARLSLNRMVVTSTTSSATLRNAPLRAAQRRCATQAEAKTSAEAEKAASAAGGAAEAKAAPHVSSASRGPQRKDWRTHQDIVYKKGVPMKGSLFKLPLSEQFIICLVFSVAGTSAVYLVRPQIRYLCHHGFLGLTDDAGWVNGPWLYRVLYCLIMFPSYSFILFVCGGLFGRRVWFSFMIHKMWSRFLTRNASKRLEHILDIQHY